MLDRQGHDCQDHLLERQTAAPMVWRATGNGERSFEVANDSDAVVLVTLTALATGTSAGTGPGSGASAVGKADFDTVFTTEERFKQALPDPASMAGWTPQDASARIEEEPKSAERCGPDPDWECARIARGDANFEAAGEEAH
ncbi:hypothetical protein [Streptomyces sp. Qhu_M48]|uniref:hypothetical protein n=1 Tax=Streptomyces sp. Qhu_M48 TaxID=3435889 RepID=UPI003F50610F